MTHSEKIASNIVYLLLFIASGITLYRIKKNQKKLYKLKPKTKHIISNELENNFEYYRKLSVKHKQLFIRRVFTFIETKKWIARNGIELTLNKKILISASAVQLTFGLDTYLMPHFTVIDVYPNVYTNRFTGYKHKGDVDVRGKISLSWKYFEEGYAIADDKINLGLHEMAHALDISALTKTSEYLQLLFERFRTNYKDKYKEFLENKYGFLREYAKVNEKEFFAVLIETYFENAKEFQKNMPELYIDMCFLLNQDIIHNIHRDFIGIVDKATSKCKNNAVVNNSDVIKMTSFNITSFLRATPIYLGVLGVLYVWGYKNNTDINVIIPFIIVIYIIHFAIFYILSKRITLTKNYLILSNLFGKKQCIDLFNIIAVIYNEGKIEIAFFENSKYKKIKVKTTAKQSDIEDILSYLSKTQVLVKLYMRKKDRKVKSSFINK